jgi:hypothetical protein
MPHEVSVIPNGALLKTHENLVQQALGQYFVAKSTIAETMNLLFIWSSCNPTTENKKTMFFFEVG